MGMRADYNRLFAANSVMVKIKKEFFDGVLSDSVYDSPA